MSAPTAVDQRGPGHEDLGRLRLVASAVAGRAMEVAPAASGDPAWTDGATIFVDPASARVEQIRALCVQASLLGAGSLAPEIADSLVRRPALARRYLAVEGHRALATLGDLVPTTVRPLIDRDLAARCGSSAESLGLAASRQQLPEPPEAFGAIRPRALRRAADEEGNGGVTGHPRSTSEADVLRELDDDQEDERQGLDLLSSPVGGAGPIGRLLKRFLGDTRGSRNGPPGADSPTHHARAKTGRSPGMATTMALASTSSSGAAVRYEPTTYPEWDVHRRRYRHSWCTVSEVAPPFSSNEPCPVPDTLGLRRPLARLGLALQRRDRQLQGTDIDIDAVVDAHVEAMAGAPPEEGVYVDLVRSRRDLAVLVLLDVSGSAGQPSAAGGTVHDHQRAAAAGLTFALHDLGDRVALYAFRSQGRSSVQVLPLKGFAESLDVRVLQRLGGCVPGAYTRLGAAIRHSTAVLERDAGMSRRLLVVLSDGFAYDHGYEGAYGEADAQRALVEARHRGTGCVCLSVGATTEPAALRRVFGSAAHAGVGRLEDLPRIIGPLLRFALRSAEAQRREHQRSVRLRARKEMETVR